MTRSAPAADPSTSKDRLLDAALTEFVEHGFDGTSTAAIAERAGVTKAMVFHHFASKDALFLAVSERVVARAQQEYAKVIDETPPDLLVRMLAWTRRKFEMFRADPREVRFMVFTIASAPRHLREQCRAEFTQVTKDDTRRLVEGMDPARLRVSPQEAINALETVALGIEQRFYQLPIGAKAAAQIEAFSAEALTLLTLVAKALYRKDPGEKKPRR